LWNEYGGDANGFSISVGEKELRYCCDKGAEVLETYFSHPPSPFKRVGAFVVLARLFPFFGFTKSPPTPVAKNQWYARLAALLIPPTLRGMKVDVSDDDQHEKWMLLDKWTGFPSPHVKVEFLAWLEWLDPLQGVPPPSGMPREDWESLLNDRLARMILRTSLLIENMYYLCEISAKVGTEGCLRGQCRRCMKGINLTGLNYDGILYQNWLSKHKT